MASRHGFLVTDLVGGVAIGTASGRAGAPDGSGRGHRAAARGFKLGRTGLAPQAQPGCPPRPCATKARARGTRSRSDSPGTTAICYPHATAAGVVGHARCLRLQLGSSGASAPAAPASIDGGAPAHHPPQRRHGELPPQAPRGRRSLALRVDGEGAAARSAAPSCSSRSCCAARWMASTRPSSPRLRRSGVRRCSRMRRPPAPPTPRRWLAGRRAQALRAAGAEGLWVDPRVDGRLGAGAGAGTARGRPRRRRIRGSWCRTRGVNNDPELTLPPPTQRSRARSLLNRVPTTCGGVTGGRDGEAAGDLLAFGEAAGTSGHRQGVDDARVCALAGLDVQGERPPLTLRSPGPRRLPTSVVIPTYDRDEQLARLLDSLERQTLLARAQRRSRRRRSWWKGPATARSNRWSARATGTRAAPAPLRRQATGRGSGAQPRVLAGRRRPRPLPRRRPVARGRPEQHLAFHAVGPPAHACSVCRLERRRLAARPLSLESDEYLDWKHVFERDRRTSEAGAFWTGQLSLKRRLLLHHGVFDAGPSAGIRRVRTRDGRRLEPAGLVLHFRPQSVTGCRSDRAASLARRQRMKGWSSRTLSSRGWGHSGRRARSRPRGSTPAWALTRSSRLVAAFEAAVAEGDRRAGRDLDRIYATTLRYAALGAAPNAKACSARTAARSSRCCLDALVEASVRDLWAPRTGDRRGGQDLARQGTAAADGAAAVRGEGAQVGRAERELNDERARLEVALRVRGTSGGRARRAYRELKHRLAPPSGNSRTPSCASRRLPHLA